MTVSDGMQALPTASISLPLHTIKGNSRVLWKDLFQPGDFVLIEALNWLNDSGEWTTLIHGQVASPQNAETINPDSYDVNTTVSVVSMARILERDTFSWWLYVATLEGWYNTTTKFMAGQLVGKPANVAFDYLTKIAFGYSSLDLYGLKLEDVIHLGFNGLQAISNYETSLTTFEGTHLSIVQSLLDQPFHELFVTTMPESLLKGQKIRPASKAPGVDKSATTIIMRAAPYPFADANGKGDITEWNKLRLHDLTTIVLEPVKGVGFGSSDVGVRNFFVAYPALKFLDDSIMLASGQFIKNQSSIRRFGQVPLKTRTRLVFSPHELKPEEVLQFTKKITYRLAAQWNKQEQYTVGQASIPLSPQIRPGDRVRMYLPFTSNEIYQFHVQARTMTLNPSTGGSMTLTLERGLPEKTYQTPAWFVENLEPVTVFHPSVGQKAGHDERK